MTTTEIVERLFLLAEARLKNRLGAFEQFAKAVKYTAQGEQLKADAYRMPKAWHQALNMGLPEAAKLIDAHLLTVIDQWASTESSPLPITPLAGFSPAQVEAPTSIYADAPQQMASDEPPAAVKDNGPAVTTDALCEGFDGVKFTSLEWRLKITKGAPDWLLACCAGQVFTDTAIG